ncbi:spermatogenesis-associated protein 2-like protein isoform X1 [Anolis sagrei]|uniref:spermatogenesis-associated protein 2-like protein isoform X1 n=1 Tax=Anolis sagrei TaxID=38937 RepID=UPI0035223E34
MSPSAALQEEYGRCLERDFRRGHTGVCADQSLKELLWHHLLADPDLHQALRGEDTLATLATALRGHLDLGAALRNLAKAFEVLELAAINLYFFPWRKEFGTIKTFSGVYVHVLQGILPEADLARSFRRLGYVPRDGLRLALAQLPPGPALLGAACGFFAARVECEILGKMVQELEPCLPLPEDLLRARRESAGSLEACVAKLRSLVRRPAGKGGPPEPPEGVDLYQEGPEEPLAGGRLAPLPLCERGATRGPWEQQPWSPPLEDRNKQGDSEESYGNGIPDPEDPSLETAFSFISLRRELSRAAETDSSAQPLSRFLPPGAPFESTSFQGMSDLASPPSRPPRSPQLSPLVARRPQPLGAGPPCYHLHSCLFPGALPASCCNTCRSLHGSGCDIAQLCRGKSHDLEELQTMKQQRLWLQRTEVDKLLHDGGGGGGGPWQ